MAYVFNYGNLAKYRQAGKKPKGKQSYAEAKHEELMVKKAAARHLRMEAAKTFQQPGSVFKP